MVRSTVLLDLNNPEFLEEFLNLEARELRQVAKALAKIQGMDWDAVYKVSGLKWEKIDHIPSPSGHPVYSLRLSKKARALAFREGNFLRFLSLHPDHDSAYRRK